jgi:Domain of unknown function (DUF4190)/zinc-ribbon domain
VRCPNCGHVARERTRFCARCGQPLPWDDATATTGAAPANPAGTGPAPPWGAPTPGAYTPPPPYSPPSMPGAANPYAPPNLYGPPGAQPVPGDGSPAGFGPPRTNGFAVASLVLGIVGWMPCGVGSILAVVFAVIAQNQIKAASGREGGAGLAKAGLILGCIGIALWVVYFLIVAIVTASNPDGV